MPPTAPFFPVTDQSSFSSFQAAGLNNEAQILHTRGNLAGAERKHVEALRVKIAASGEHSVHVGLTQNALGELYLEMGRLDDAKVMLEEADAIRAVTGPKFDEACTKDNLGRMS